MSRIGKKPVPVPAGVTASVTGQLVKVKGAKGELSFDVPTDVSVVMENGGIAVQPRSQTKRARAMWGMSRSRVANLVTGVTAGYEKKLEITGVGYRAARQRRRREEITRARSVRLDDVGLRVETLRARHGEALEIVIGRIGAPLAQHFERHGDVGLRK